MQKKIIAVAVAALASGAAFAQSNVTIYGVADAYYGHATADNKSSQNTINSGGWSGSRLGFKGTEDLGEGLKVLVTLEYGLNIDDTSGIGVTSAGAGNARQQFVGLAGSFGTVVLGRRQSVGYVFEDTTNALHGTAFNPLQTVVKAANFGEALIDSSSRLNNTVSYVSPKMSGFTFAYDHSRNTESANTAATKEDDSANLMSLTYGNGPLTLSAIYTKLTKDSTAANDDVKELGFGGSYDFRVLKLYGTYQTAAVGSATKNKAWQLSGVIPVSATGNVVVEVAGNKIDSTAASDDSKSYALFYQHNLSKRTMAYTGYQRVSNDNAASAGTALNTAANGGLPTAGGSAGLLVLGMRHTF